MATKKAIYEEIRTRRVRRPFVPFTIVIKDNRRFEITEPFSFAMNERILVVIPPGSTSERISLSEVREVVPRIVESPEMPSEFFYG